MTKTVDEVRMRCSGQKDIHPHKNFFCIINLVQSRTNWLMLVNVKLSLCACCSVACAIEDFLLATTWSVIIIHIVPKMAPITS